MFTAVCNDTDREINYLLGEEQVLLLFENYKTKFLDFYLFLVKLWLI